MHSLDLTSELVEDFRQAYKQARRDALPVFSWRNHDIPLRYAKSFLEYADSILERRKNHGLNEGN